MSTGTLALKGEHSAFWLGFLVSTKAVKKPRWNERCVQARSRCTLGHMSSYGWSSNRSRTTTKLKSSDLDGYHPIFFNTQCDILGSSSHICNVIFLVLLKLKRLITG